MATYQPFTGVVHSLNEMREMSILKGDSHFTGVVVGDTISPISGQTSSSLDVKLAFMLPGYIRSPRLMYRGVNIRVHWEEGCCVLDWSTHSERNSMKLGDDPLHEIRSVMSSIDTSLWNPLSREIYTQMHKGFQETGIYHCETYSPDKFFLRVKITGMPAGEAMVFKR
jgi:hypothetical protein